MARACCVICTGVIFVAALVFAQEQPENENTPSGKNHDESTVDCGRFGSSPGCKSFNEMVSHGDKGLLDSLGDASHSAFVCFPEDEDTFFIFEFDPPDDFQPMKANPVLEESWAMASYSKYERGTLGSFQGWADHWRKRKTQASDLAKFQSKNRAGSTCLIDSDEVVLDFNFENLKGMQIDYNLSIRRSTGRFLETYSSGDHKRSGVHQSETSGHCVKRSSPQVLPPPV